MKAKFQGGPWDGVECDLPFIPDQIGFRHMVSEFKGVVAASADEFVTQHSFYPRDHHQYLLEDRRLKEGVKLVVGKNIPREPEEDEDPLDLADEKVVEHIYRYAPREQVWWDR